MAGYLLDTNIISETRKVKANERVTAFLSNVDESGMFLSVLTLGELRKGVKMKHKTDPTAASRLSSWVDGIETIFASRILPIDIDITRLWGELSAAGDRPVIDTLIAATALVKGLILVTRNSKDIKSTGVTFIDPF